MSLRVINELPDGDAVENIPSATVTVHCDPLDEAQAFVQ